MIAARKNGQKGGWPKGKRRKAASVRSRGKKGGRPKITAVDVKNSPMLVAAIASVSDNFEKRLNAATTKLRTRLSLLDVPIMTDDSIDPSVIGFDPACGPDRTVYWCQSCACEVNADHAHDASGRPKGKKQ